MATVQVTFKRGGDTNVQVSALGFSSNQTFTSSGTSQATTAGATNGDLVQIVVDGGNVRVTAAATPVAVANDTCELLTPGTYHFSIPVGHKVAVIDA